MNPPRRPQFPTLPPASPTAACGCALVLSPSGVRVPACEAADCDPEMDPAVSPQCKRRAARGWAVLSLGPDGMRLEPKQ